MDNESFICKKHGNLSMPTDKQVGFCAKQYRTERVGCVDCETGKAAAKTDAANVRTGLPATVSEVLRAAAKKSSEIRATEKKEKEAEMAGKALCSCGCGVKAVKEGFGWGCYRKKFGVDPFPRSTPGVKTKAKKSAKTRPDQTISSSGKTCRVKGNGHADGECEGCKALQLEISQINRAEAIMVTAGLVSADKFDQARKFVTDLGA